VSCFSGVYKYGGIGGCSMLNSLVIIAAAALMLGLLYTEKREKNTMLLLVKTTLSALFIVAALIQPNQTPLYFRFLLAALVLCLFGDVFLAIPGEKMFFSGLVSFLLGHVLYIFAFFTEGPISPMTWIGAVFVLITSTLVFYWLKPHLGSMKIPVFLYVVVISIMVCGAISVLGNPQLNVSGRAAVFIGATLFYFSDILVARDQFIKKEFSNRLFGLPLYYSGQFLLAFSAGLLRHI
jgi:uncharacterized membrane protein YhhN